MTCLSFVRVMWWHVAPVSGESTVALLHLLGVLVPQDVITVAVTPSKQFLSDDFAAQSALLDPVLSR